MNELYNQRLNKLQLQMDFEIVENISPMAADVYNNYVFLFPSLEIL